METTNETKVVEGDYENPWTYQGSTFTSDDIYDFFGYVYRIQIFKMVGNTSEESILHSVESLEVGNAELRVRVTGNATTEVLTNLNPMLNDWAKRTLNEKSSPSTLD